MLFQTYGDRRNPAVLFFHAMGVTGASSEPVVKYLQDRYFCILPTSTVYCAGQKYVSKADEIRQVEDFLHRQGVERLAMVVASSIGADLAMAFLTSTKLPVEHAFFDGGQFTQIGKGTRRIMTPFLYFAIKSLYWSKGGTLKKILWCDDESVLHGQLRLRQKRHGKICADGGGNHHRKAVYILPVQIVLHLPYFVRLADIFLPFAVHGGGRQNAEIPIL